MMRNEGARKGRRVKDGVTLVEDEEGEEKGEEESFVDIRGVKRENRH